MYRHDTRPFLSSEGAGPPDYSPVMPATESQPPILTCSRQNLSRNGLEKGACSLIARTPVFHQTMTKQLTNTSISEQTKCQSASEVIVHRANSLVY